MKKFTKLLAVFTALVLTISMFPVTATETEAETITFTDDFSGYAEDGDFSSNWTVFNEKAESPVVITTDAPGGDGVTKWVEIFADNYWTNIMTIGRGVTAKTKVPDNSVTDISVRLRRNNGGATGAVRFLDDGNGNYYQLSIPRVQCSVTYFENAAIPGKALANFVRNKYAATLGVTGDNINSIDVSGYYTTWVLSKNTTVGGVSTHTIIDVFEHTDSLNLDTANKKVSTKDVTIDPWAGAADYDQIITIKTDKATGEISFDINGKAHGDTLQTKAAGKLDVKATVYDEAFKNSANKDCSVSLVGAGQNNQYSYFTDFSVTAVKYAEPERVVNIPVATDDGAVFSFADDFSGYPGSDGAYDFSANWIPHNESATTPATITSHVKDTEETYWFKLNASGYWTNLADYAGVGTDKIIPGDSVQNIRARVRRGNNGETFAIRFLDDGNGNYYQLTIPRAGSSVTYEQGTLIANFVRNKYASALGVTGDDISSIDVSGFYTAWIISKNTKVGTTSTHEIVAIYEDTENLVLDKTNKKVSTSNVTVDTHGGDADWDQIVTVKTDKDSGEISVDINSVNFGDNVYLKKNAYADVKGTIYDEAFKNSSVNLCGVKLLARGQGGQYTYFTDFSVTAERLPATVNEIYTEDFSTYGDVAVAQMAPSTILKDSNGNNINWQAHSNRMGFAQGDDGDGVTYARVGITQEDTVLKTPALLIEARADAKVRKDYPAVIYTGNYPETAGYHVKFRVTMDNLVGGIRIASNETFNDYYEVKIHNNVGIYINKVTDGDEAAVQQLAFCDKTSELVQQHVGYSVPGAKNIYVCELFIADGEIKFTANVLENPHHWTMGWMTASDKVNPINIENASMAFFAAGNMNNYCKYTDFSVESYDLWEYAKTEPAAVLYQNVAKDITPDENGIIVLDDETVIRRVVSSISGDIMFSRDGESFYKLGTGTNVLNTKSALAFKYVKVPVGASAKVYTNVGGKNISAPLYSNPEFAYYNDGVEVDPLFNLLFDDGAYGEVGYYNYDGTVYVKSQPQESAIFTFADYLNLEPEFISTVNVAVTSPYVVSQENGKIKVRAYISTDITETAGKAIVAFTNADGTLVEAKVADAAINNGITEFTVDDVANAANAKVMIWNGFKNAKPLSTAYSVR